MTRAVAQAGATTGSNAINKQVWSWNSDPFGTTAQASTGGSANSAPNKNPQLVTGTAAQIAAASYEQNLRMPGQYEDQETKKFYNGFRTYDPVRGQYDSSDPIGLRGGKNTFGYVGGNPVRAIDPLGLVKWEGALTGVSAAAGPGGGLYFFDMVSPCKCGKRARATGFASGVGAGLGGAIGKYKAPDLSLSGGAQGFEDANACPDPDVFNGKFLIAQASFVLPWFGGSCGNVFLGQAVASLNVVPGSSWCSGGSVGLDIGVTSFVGASAVVKSSIEPCSCESGK
jgi:RHS repeat-associated protein